MTTTDYCKCNVKIWVKTDELKQINQQIDGYIAELFETDLLGNISRQIEITNATGE